MKNNLLAAIGCGLLVSSFPGMAQTNELSFSAGAGIGGLQYTVKNGTASLKQGFQAGFGYTRQVNAQWGIRTGLELGYYHTKATLAPNTVYTSYQVDSEGDGFEYRVKTNGYSETQELYAINIPLLLQLQSAPGRTEFYGSGGVKLALPLNAAYTSEADQIIATGYYPNLNAEITDLPAHGFGVQNGWSNKGRYTFRPSWSLAAEAGMRFRLSPYNNLYAGFYIDYGLNDIKKTEGNNRLLTYQPAGLAQSEAAGIFSLSDETGSARLVAYGIKLRVGFSSSKAKKKMMPIAEATPLHSIPDTPVAITPPARVAIDTVVKAPPVADTLVANGTPTRGTLTEEERKLLETPFMFEKVGDTALSPAAREQALKIVALLKAHPGISVRIEGHTCDIGYNMANEVIGLGRAKAVAAWLQNHGIEASRMLPVSRAHYDPIVPNSSEENRKLNRRVVLKIM